jgi:hypothetical protein
MERSKIPLNKWLLAVHLIGSSKQGMSVRRLQQALGIAYLSAWFLAQRIREPYEHRRTRSAAAENR